MPYCSAAVLNCNLPVRFDTYRGGCEFRCTYCSELVHGRFNPKPFESFKSLESWIKGIRNADTNWCDWDIPLHFGVLSDPLPFNDTKTRRSYKALYTFAEKYYPVVVTTKSTLAIDDDYLHLLNQCNVVVQVSMVSKSFSVKYETNAPSFRDRFSMLYKVSKNTKRLVVRCQPFMIEYLDEVLMMIPAYTASGVHALLVGGISLRRPVGKIDQRSGDGYTYHVESLVPSLVAIRECCHDNNLVFLNNECGLDYLSDSIICCGTEGLEGFNVNKCNLSFSYEDYVTESMKAEGSAQVFRSGCRDSRFKYRTYIDVLRQFDNQGNDGFVR